MKSISIKLQRIILWIPFCNAFVQFIYAYNCWNATNSGKHVFGWLKRMFVIAVCFALIDCAVVNMANLPDIARNVWEICSTYLLLWVCDYVVIRYQIKHSCEFFSDPV